MRRTVNETHDPELQSWVESANDPETDFPIQNLPLGVFWGPDNFDSTSIGVAIGDQVLNLSALTELLWVEDYSDYIAEACSQDTLEMVMMMDTEEMGELRERLVYLLSTDYDISDREVVERLLIPMSEVEMAVPTTIGNFTDFYASIYHATNIGRIFRPDNPLMPNYKWIPVGYHGRASTIFASGTNIRRPSGQMKDDAAESPEFGPSRVLDYEMEMGCFISLGNDLGEPITIAAAEDQIFGLCLVNDWSARDIQRWEYQPLGPFLAKSFATSISPWVVTMEALAPFRVPAFERGEDDPQPLDYLDSSDNRERGGFDIQLDVFLSTKKMREEKIEPHRLSISNTKYLYWTFAQMVTHHASNGCVLEPGDLIASGTVSGPTDDSLGCLIELTDRGTRPIELPSGETRRFLEDGDEVIMRGYCEREGFRRIGFGECRGIVAG